MSSTAGEILNDILEALRATEAFAAVTLGAEGDAARWPRAEVLPVGLEDSRADDLPRGRWSALKATVTVHVRTGRWAEGLQRALELAEQARQSLLEDPFRGQRCRDLPIGRATELGGLKVSDDVKPPCVAVAFEVRCHFQSQEES